MPAFIRRCHGKDWFTPAEIRHLPKPERYRLMVAVKRRTGCQYFPLFALIVMIVPPAVTPLLLLYSAWLYKDQAWMLTIVAILFVSSALSVWFAVSGQRRFRKELREQLLVENICPARCFECYYFTEGFAGSECPNCGAILLAPKANPSL
jgi:hypothetical protein